MSQPTITWTRPMLEEFKLAYREAVKVSREGSFKFHGFDFYPPYAEYLIEYLETKLSWG